MKKTVYIETSIVSYLTARPTRDVRAAAWQEITSQWWEQSGPLFILFVSELVIVEVSRGDNDAVARRLGSLAGIRALTIDDEVRQLAARLIADGGMADTAQADALHVAVAAIHQVDYLLTWNCRHIDNAATKPLMRSICSLAGYRCPEICTPLELSAEGD